MIIHKCSKRSVKYRIAGKCKPLFGDTSGKIKTFAIVSSENPFGCKDCTEEEFKLKYAKWTGVPHKFNKERLAGITATDILNKVKKNGELTVRYGGFKCISSENRFGGEHKACLLIFNIPVADAEVIARGYGQLSFLWVKMNDNINEPAAIAYYESKNACITYKPIEVSDKIATVKDAEDMLFKHGFKIGLSLKHYTDELEEPSSVKDFECSFDENSTFMGRAIYRRRAYTSDHSDSR